MLPNSCLCPVSVKYSILLFLRSHLHTLCSKILVCQLFLDSRTVIFHSSIFYCYFYLAVKIIKIKPFLHSFFTNIYYFCNYYAHTEMLSLYEAFFYEHKLYDKENNGYCSFTCQFLVASIPYLVCIHILVTLSYQAQSVRKKSIVRFHIRCGALNVVQICCERPPALNVRRQSLHTTNLLKYRCVLTILQLYLLF